MRHTDEELLALYGIGDRTAPRLRANFIASLDGAATHQGLTAGLNNEDDKRVFDLLRRVCDVVLVGAGTIRAERYADLRLEAPAIAWRREHGLPAQPTLAIVSAELDLDPEMAVFARAPVRPIICTHGSSPSEKRAQLARVADVIVGGTATLDPRAMLRALAERGLRQVLCEGGPHLLGTLLEADCVDELCLTLSPVLENGSAGRIAAGAPQATRRMRLGHVISAGDMLMLRYERAR
ncbi:MAG TPA: pyrimidine reductase family protein [Burkholderiales bacterium]|nr:pyrimidine reductase family protein [Burkholderiales bacterium]